MTSPERFRRLVDIVGEAMSLPPSERDAFVEAACAGDPELLGEARSLLAEANATSFDAVTARLGARVQRAAAEASAIPSHVGPYKIVELLGEGGMGLVYRAEQTEPIRRDVALKVARGGLRGESARARFDAERQALALMDHPGIARIFDAGATADGAPYFAMELVRGDPITAFCDQHRLDVDARVALVADVCRAVQHAHIKGVIHRDLKPSNILVTMIDERAQARVIDFGIAKAIESTGDAETMHTALGAVIGTLEYMSPEQATAGVVDTRSDIYSLGVILYELVTGSLPFDSALLRATPAAAQHLIRDTDPPTPVRRFTSTEQRDAIAHARDTDARALAKRLDGDLGWIVMKAIEKDPARRYQNASDFAADLERLRAHQPVDAGPPSRRYRAARFVRRHRTAVVAASLVFVALVAGVTLATVGFVRAKHAQTRAELEARRATRISDFLTKMLAQGRPDMMGRDVTVLEMVDSTAAHMTTDTTFADDPLVHGNILHALGETYRTLDQYDRAIPLFQQALALKRSAPGDNDRTILVTLNKLSECQAQIGDLAAAIETQKDVVATAERALGKETDDYSAYLMNLGNMYADAGQLATAEPLLRESLAIQKRVNDPTRDPNIPFSINNLATVLVDLGKCDDAIPLHQESIALRRRMFPAPSAEIAVAFGNYARALDCAGRSPEARVFADSAVTMCTVVFGPDHMRTATSRVRLAEAMLHTGDTAGAEPLLRSAIATFTAINPRLWRVGDARARLGEVLLALGRTQEGIGDVTKGWEIYTETTAATTLRAREMATVAADYYQKNAETTLAAAWRERAALPAGQNR